MAVRVLSLYFATVSFPCGSWNDGRMDVLSFLGGRWVELAVEQRKPFPIKTKECINITTSTLRHETPESPLIIFSVDVSSERRLMD